MTNDSPRRVRSVSGLVALRVECDRHRVAQRFAFDRNDTVIPRHRCRDLRDRLVGPDLKHFDPARDRVDPHTAPMGPAGVSGRNIAVAAFIGDLSASATASGH